MGESLPCDEPSSSGFMKCQCAFLPDAPQAEALMRGPLLHNITSDYCPAYTSGMSGGVYTTTLNEEDRKYQKVTLTVEYDTEKDDGSMTATAVKVDEDHNQYRDSMNTFDVEVCEGVESILTPEDPPEKCSFGHRLHGQSNCYGKLEMDYDSAVEACDKRGGHLLKIDSFNEMAELRDVFGITQLGMGLHLDDSQDTERGLEWDGYPGCKAPRVDHPFVKRIDYNPYQGCYVFDTRTFSYHHKEVSGRGYKQLCSIQYVRLIALSPLTLPSPPSPIRTVL
jgi:hypothetical protein